MTAETDYPTGSQDHMTNDVWITGIGLTSSLGEGRDAHWQALNAGTGPVLDRQCISPYAFHPMAELDLSLQIPKRGDQRQMEPWQRYGVYTAGLALDDANVKDDPDLLSRMDMIVAAGGGERDIAVDNQIMSELLKSNDRAKLLIERLSNELRPTLFLAQLPNLVAGNISIVHGVTGSSRTFMGEEAAGHDAVRTAHARVAAGQSRICLVGGAFNAAREDMLLLFEMVSGNWLGEADSVWARDTGNGGVRLGSMGAFLVLEAADHARARGARPVARLEAVVADRGPREAGSVGRSLSALWSRIGGGIEADTLGVVSGATGIAGQTAEELGFLETLSGAPIRAAGTHLGHGLEAQFPASLAIAALCISHGKVFPAADASVETNERVDVERALVTSVGHWRGEGLALVARAET